MPNPIRSRRSPDSQATRPAATPQPDSSSTERLAAQQATFVVREEMRSRRRKCLRRLCLGPRTTADARRQDSHARRRTRSPVRLRERRSRPQSRIAAREAETINGVHNRAAPLQAFAHMDARESCESRTARERIDRAERVPSGYEPRLRVIWSAIARTVQRRILRRDGTPRRVRRASVSANSARTLPFAKEIERSPASVIEAVAVGPASA
jgi:hypothetical protein